MSHDLHSTQAALLQPLRRLRHASPQNARPAVVTTEALERSLALDAQTSWPTHRIRSFLSTQRQAQGVR
jgi:hypothetical protein